MKHDTEFSAIAASYKTRILESKPNWRKIWRENNTGLKKMGRTLSPWYALTKSGKRAFQKWTLEKLMVTKGDRWEREGWTRSLGWKFSKTRLWWWLYDYKYNKIQKKKWTRTQWGDFSDYKGKTGLNSLRGNEAQAHLTWVDVNDFQTTVSDSCFPKLVLGWNIFTWFWKKNKQTNKKKTLIRVSHLLQATSSLVSHQN